MRIEPLVSIIIPVYNVEDYLEECLQSAVNQTYKNIEIIIVNDGSTDSSQSIIECYKDNYPYISAINQSNLGLSCARNAGIKQAKGKYIYFLDSDDFIELETIKDCLELAEEKQLDILQFDAKVFYEDDMDSHFDFNYDRSNVLDNEIYKGGEFYNLLINKKIYKSPVWLSFYNKEFLIKNKLEFFRGITHEDELFSVQAFILAERVMYTPQSYFNRRIRKNSIMTQNISLKNIDGYMTVAHELARFSYEVSNKEVLHTLKKEVINFYYRSIGLSLYIIEDQNELINKLIEIRKKIFSDLFITKEDKKLLIKVVCPKLYIYYLSFTKRKSI